MHEIKKICVIHIQKEMSMSLWSFHSNTMQVQFPGMTKHHDLMIESLMWIVARYDGADSVILPVIVQKQL